MKTHVSMLATAILALGLFVFARFLARRSWSGTPAEMAIPIGAVIVYVMGIATYPFVLKDSVATMFPQPAAQPSLGPVAAVPARPPQLARTVTCPANASLNSTKIRGSIDSVAVGTQPSTTASGEIHVPARSTIHVVGWAALSSGPAANICVLVDGRFTKALATYGLARPDVATALGRPDDTPTGFAIDVPTQLSAGKHTMAVGAANAGSSTVSELAISPLVLSAQ